MCSTSITAQASRRWRCASPNCSTGNPALAEAGADVIQFDEPCFNIYTDWVSEWGIEALEQAADIRGVKRGVHICYGYGTNAVLAWKHQNTDWGHYSVTLPLLAKSQIDQVSVETAASRVDVSVLASLAGKDVLVGVVDVGTEEVETAETVASRIRRILPFVPPDRLFPCSDCGMVPRSRARHNGKAASAERWGCHSPERAASGCGPSCESVTSPTPSGGEAWPELPLTRGAIRTTRFIYRWRS